jgi:N utilization substance protein A
MVRKGNKEFAPALAQVASERGLDKDVLLEAIKEGLKAAAKKKLGEAYTDNLLVEINEKTGEPDVYATKEVVPEVTNPALQITLDEAKELDDSAELGDTLTILVTPEDFGRIAVQTARQVMSQKFREAEKTSVNEEFSTKINTIINAKVQRKEGEGYLLDLGRTEALLERRDQVRGERYNPKDEIKVYVVGVDNTARGPKIRVSRTHPNMIRVLFETEVPEIHDKIIEIKAVAREPGSRAKVAVKSNDPEVGAVGTCVGHMGGRIHNIVKALGNEKIDIIEWVDDPMELIASALKPAKINKIRLEENETENGAEKKALVFVANDQLSLAIGRAGQNVRLASKLTGWNIDIQEEKTSFTENLAKAAAEQKPAENETGKSSLTENLKAAAAEAKAAEAKKQTETVPAAEARPEEDAAQ